MSAKLFCLAAAAALACSPAFAAESSIATVGSVKGSVLVSQGGKMVQAGTASLKAGDRIVASANGSAVVKFADGCTVSLKPASMITVSSKSPCASGAGLVNATQAQPQDIWGMSNTTAAIVGVVVVGGIAAAIASNNNNSTSP